MTASSNTSHTIESLYARNERPCSDGGAVVFVTALGLALLLAGATAGGAATPAPRCDNNELTDFDGLLVVAPHPDDETLGFGGLLTAYREQGKPVRTVVATDGDAYCVACAFWKSASTHGPTCNARDLSNLATPEVDSFAEVRRAESRAAATVLGLPEPRFLGYPDTGLAAAWRNRQQGEAERPLRRSDFSMCEQCGDCSAGYGGGPRTELTSRSLAATIAELLAETTPRTLVATTHPLDGHGDHAALGELVRAANGELAEPRALAFAVIHAHTPKDAAHPDCWYPGPRAAVCPCHDEERAAADPGWLAAQRAERLLPAATANLPDDAAYGEEKQLCLPQEMVTAEPPTKLAALESYASQLGFAAREGEVPEALEGLVDCNGYLLAFVRRTEAFVLVD